LGAHNLPIPHFAGGVCRFLSKPFFGLVEAALDSPASPTELDFCDFSGV